MLVSIYLACVAAIFYGQINKVKTAKCTKVKAVVLNAAYAIAPVVLYGAVFIMLIDVGEITDTAIIGELYARTLSFVIAEGVAIVLLTTLIFSLVVLAMKRRNTNAM